MDRSAGSTNKLWFGRFVVCRKARFIDHLYTVNSIAAAVEKTSFAKKNVERDRSTMPLNGLTGYRSSHHRPRVQIRGSVSQKRRELPIVNTLGRSS